jgi:hypothetical protein
MMMSGQNAGQNRNINIANRSSENVKTYTYLERALKNRHYIHEGTKSELNSWNAC